MQKSSPLSTRPTILLVDDDERARIIVREVLEQGDFLVEEAGDGAAAIEMFDAVNPDLVLLDVVMPTMDGFETCLEIRKRPNGAHTPIVLMTGLEDSASIDRAFEIGATSFITKPTNYALLVHRLRYVLRTKETADRLRDSEARLGRAQALARLGHWEWKRGQDGAVCSDDLGSFFGLPEGVDNLRYRDFMRLVAPGDRRRVRETAHRSLKAGRGYRIEHRLVQADGGERIVHHEVDVSTDAQGRIQRITGIAQDITERRRSEERIRYLAYFDPVTGLGNRSLLKQLFNHTLVGAKRYRRVFSLLFLDLDHFKRINDAHGHEVGDALLKEVSARLRRCLRSSDRVMKAGHDDETPLEGLLGGDAVTRLGGDEFAILLTEIQRPENAAAVARRIAEAVAVPATAAGETVSLTSSIGIATYPSDGQDFDTLAKRAESAMVQAKAGGGGRIEFFADALNERSSRRMALEAELRRGLEDQAFELHFQPKVRSRDRQPTGVEALVRWRHPIRGLLDAAEFIPLAEDVGLIEEIGAWALRAALAQVADWRDAGRAPLPVAVNVSAAECGRPGFEARVRRLLAEFHLEPARLQLEVREGVLLDAEGPAVAALRALHGDGVAIVLDDFGVGLSSVAALVGRPVDAVKIDVSLVSRLEQDAAGDALVRGVVALAHTLGLATIAEGVEGRTTFRQLAEIGCNEQQGFGICEPRSAEALAAWLDDQAASPDATAGRTSLAVCR